MRRRDSDRWFLGVLGAVMASYAGLIVLVVGADVLYLVRSTLTALQASNSWWETLLHNPLITSLGKQEIQYAVRLTLLSCTLTALLSLVVAVPAGYLLARYEFWGRRLLDAVIDIPIVLPPLVLGLSLLILFQFWPFTVRVPGMGKTLSEMVVYQIPAVVLAQFAVAAAFAVRTMKVAFEHRSPRCEQVALTLGCNRFQAFFHIVLPDVGQAMLAAASMAWARALGEFGPLLIFAGATRRKTEVLSTTVFLELSIGNLEAAVAVSLYMVVAAMAILLLLRYWGEQTF
jgi:molybdate transport system permease protein